MANQTIIFQVSMQYLTKLALHIEYLLQTLEQACNESNPIIHHYALNNILELLKIIDKPELKGRFLKELLRIEHSNNKSQQPLPDDLYARLFVQIQLLSNISGRFGESIHTDSFLQCIRPSQSPHNTEQELCTPQLSFWLQNTSNMRQQQLSAWFSLLKPLLDLVELYLSLLRAQASFKLVELTRGEYRCALPKLNAQLLLLRMNNQPNSVPNIQMGHHGLVLRLPHTKEEQEIELAICQI